MKKMLIILDGASGRGVKAFNGKTSLDAAETPNLDYLTKKGKMGYMYPINEKIVPGSDDSILSIFGNDYKKYGRGIFEAIGVGVELTRGDLALRTNFGTIENLKSKKVIDRRAGRTLSTKEAKILAKALNEQIKLPCKFKFYSTIQHRGVLVLRGGFSDNITNIDPEYSNGKNSEFKFSEPLDDEEITKYTANILNAFVSEAYKVLENHPINLKRKKKGLMPANFFFTRGAEVKKPKLKQYKSWMSINPMPLEIGISKASGMNVFSFNYPALKKIDVYRNLYAGLEKTIKFAIKTIKKQHKHYSGCYIQLKETDIPGHDNKPFEKKKMLEIIDKKFFGFIRKFAEKNKILLVVTCDHSTPCKLKMHSADAVPVLVSGKEADESEKFCEKEAKQGSLGKMYGRNFFKKTGLNR
jgi:2,3-bisphosphoglycerate-independent phosphoglycerate mutase